MIREPYRIEKYVVGDHLGYRLYFHRDEIGTGKTFEECEAIAEDHQEFMKYIDRHLKPSILTL